MAPLGPGLLRRLPEAELWLSCLSADTSVVLLPPGGAGIELEGWSSGPLLAPGTELRTALDQGLVHRRCGNFLWIVARPASWHRIQLLRCRRGTLVAERRVHPPYGLTQREAEVLHLVSEGRSNAEIAARLWVSVRTVTTHVEHLFVKLGTHSRVALAATAIREGIVLLWAPGSAREDGSADGPWTGDHLPAADEADA